MKKKKKPARVLHGDCREVLRQLPDCSVDAIVTDPPYELGFMNKVWDSTGIAYDVTVWQECLRVLKVGGHLLAFGGSRTYHRLACAIEDAGFQIREQIMWVYGSGFPKSLNIGKQDGCESWEGWGTALKPAHEPIVMARKPFDGTVANNVLVHGVGGINIDGCRVGDEIISTHNAPSGTFAGGELDRGSDTDSYQQHQGRFPANFIHDGSDEVLELVPSDKPNQSVARFFYCAKTNKKDRNEGATNNHPTVKPTDLMIYLCRLVTPPNGTVLDPFTGSGSTGKAAILEGFNFIGIEQSAEYVEIATARINHAIQVKRK